MNSREEVAKKSKVMTFLNFVNYYFFQWFCIRITRNEEKRFITGKLVEISLIPGNIYGPTYEAVHNESIKWLSVQYWVVPLSGYGKPFSYYGSPKFLRITKKRVYKVIESKKIIQPTNPHNP